MIGNDYHLPDVGRLGGMKDVGNTNRSLVLAHTGCLNQLCMCVCVCLLGGFFFSFSGVVLCARARVVVLAVTSCVSMQC